MKDKPHAQWLWSIFGRFPAEANGRRPHPNIGGVIAMASDPWSRPTFDDLKYVLENIGRSDVDHNRAAERLELSVPAEILTMRGATIPAMTREISRFGIGLLHRGAVNPGEVTVKMASDTREYQYQVLVEWCHPCESGMFISGGKFLSKHSD